MLPLTPEDETEITDDPESTTITSKVPDVPVPSPGKYVIMKKYKVADSPSSNITKRSTTLSTTGRSFTTSDKISFRKPPSVFSTSKSIADTRPTTKKLVKSVCRKSPVHHSLYDENFIRYVNELDSYFKASELRYQNSQSEEKNSFSLRSHIKYCRDASSSFEMSSGTSESAYYDGEQRSYSLDSPEPQRVIPLISLNSCKKLSSDVLDSSGSPCEDVSFHTTLEQDIPYITTPDYDNLSVCVTPSLCTTSDQSCYFTAEPNSPEDSNTFMSHLNDSSSQETLSNAFLEYDDISYNSGRDHGSTHESSCNVDESTTALAKLKLGYTVHGNIISNVETSSNENANNDDEDALTTALSQKQRMEAKIRRSNFVRSTCIDLEDDGKSEPQCTAVTLDNEEVTKKESYMKCCPV